jgi:dienelactone hydrolase
MRIVAIALGTVSLGVALAGPATAAVKTEVVNYKAGETSLVGYLAYDDAVKGKRPGVIVVHEWWGLNDYAKQRAEMLAKEGYVAFALDMYGDGKTTEHPEEAGPWASAVRGQAGVAKQRFMAAYDLFKANPRVDAAKIAAIGYCFGGAVALSMAEEGVDLVGVATFHGALPQEPVAPGTAIKAKFLVCHGADDPLIPAEQVSTFINNLKAANADFQFIQYSGARHSFSNPDAAKYGMQPLAYNEAADRRSWQAMKDFFVEVFAGQ